MSDYALPRLASASCRQFTVKAYPYIVSRAFAPVLSAASKMKSSETELERHDVHKSATKPPSQDLLQVYLDPGLKLTEIDDVPSMKINAPQIPSIVTITILPWCSAVQLLRPLISVVSRPTVPLVASSLEDLAQRKTVGYHHLASASQRTMDIPVSLDLLVEKFPMHQGLPHRNSAIAQRYRTALKQARCGSAFARATSSDGLQATIGTLPNLIDETLRISGSFIRHW